MEFLRHERDRFDWDLLIGGRYTLDEVTAALTAMKRLLGDEGRHRAVIRPPPAGMPVAGKGPQRSSNGTRGWVNSAT